MSAGASRILLALAVVACNEPLGPPHHDDKRQVPSPPPLPATRGVGPAAQVSTDAELRAPIDAQVDAAPPPTFYSALDALADVESGPLKHIGTGAWPGNYSIKACAYRNERVLVVDGYCTHREQPAFRLVMFSPSRGRVDIYAEADKPISGLKRVDYQTFYVDSEPGVIDSLDLTFAQLTDWEQKNYDHRIRGGDVCSTDVEKCVDPAWLEPARAFVADPPDAWYRLIRDLRARAATDAGKITR